MTKPSVQGMGGCVTGDFTLRLYGPRNVTTPIQLSDDGIKWHHQQDIQSLKKLSQCFAILERLTWHKSNKLSNILKIIYVIV
jgi:hypothetical protein